MLRWGQFPVLECPDHLFDVAAVKVLDPFLTELGTGSIQVVGIAELGDLAYVVARIQPPLAQFLERHVVAFNQRVFVASVSEEGPRKPAS